MVISIVVEKASDKIQHLFLKRSQNKVSTEETFHNLIIGNHENPTMNVILSGKKE